MECRGETAIEVVKRWASVNKLVVSKEKTTVLMLKGLLNARRPPHIMCSGSGIRFAQTHKYLGVTLQAELKWDMHVKTTP